MATVTTVSRITPGARGSAVPAARRRDPRFPRTARRDERARDLRRVITLALLSTIAPGSGHLIRGNRRVGRIIIRSYLVLVAVAALLAVTALVTRRPLVELAVRPELLTVVEYGAVGVAVAWCLVIVSAALAGGATGLAERHRRIAAIVIVVLCVAVATPLWATARLAAAQRGLVTTVFADGPAPGRLPDRLNILFLGGDGAPDRHGVRTDSINLASIDTATGRTVMFSLPRNLQHAPFPPGSPLHRVFPDGFSCGDECLLNAVHTYGAEHADLFPGVADPGAEAVKHAVSGILGVDVHYYVLVNMAGFEGLVDALGGVRIRVDERVPIGGVGPDGRPVPPKGYIEPGVQTLDGYHALWFARSRADSSDYARMARQRCIIGALLDQADPWTVLRKYEAIAASAEDLISTDIPRDLLPDLVEIATKVRGASVTSVQFVPPKITPSDPDFAAIRSAVADAISGTEPANEETAPAHDSADGDSGASTGGRQPDGAIDSVCPNS